MLNVMTNVYANSQYPYLLENYDFTGNVIKMSGYGNPQMKGFIYVICIYLRIILNFHIRLCSC